jgi:hypothetical protein
LVTGEKKSKGKRERKSRREKPAAFQKEEEREERKEKKTPAGKKTPDHVSRGAGCYSTPPYDGVHPERCDLHDHTVRGGPHQ